MTPDTLSLCTVIHSRHFLCKSYTDGWGHAHLHIYYLLHNIEITGANINAELWNTRTIGGMLNYKMIDKLIIEYIINTILLYHKIVEWIRISDVALQEVHLVVW